MKAATVSGAFGLDHLFQFVRAALRELRLGFAFGALSVPVRRARVLDLRDGQIEGGVEHG